MCTAAIIKNALPTNPVVESALDDSLEDNETGCAVPETEHPES